jgi:hypothetical protein
MGRVRQGSRAPAMVVTALATCGALAGAAVVNANTDRHVIEMVASYQAGGVYAPQFTVEGEVNSQKLVFAPRPDERRTDGTVWRVRRAVWSGPGLPISPFVFVCVRWASVRPPTTVSDSK